MANKKVYIVRKYIVANTLAEAVRKEKKQSPDDVSIEDLKIHLEKQFQKGMTWQNHGLHGWHIDHIKPLASFDLTDKKQFIKAVHYTNLQPLWSQKNWSKGARN